MEMNDLCIHIMQISITVTICRVLWSTFPSWFIESPSEIL